MEVWGNHFGFALTTVNRHGLCPPLNIADPAKLCGGRESNWGRDQTFTAASASPIFDVMVFLRVRPRFEKSIQRPREIRLSSRTREPFAMRQLTAANRRDGSESGCALC